MMERHPDRIKYHIFDPTGNITVLVETRVPLSLQQRIASCIMKKEPDAEQVGFFSTDVSSAAVQASLRMAGGEFCGNAAMSAAALFLLKKNSPAEKETVVLSVSGVADPVAVSLEALCDETYAARVTMPRIREIRNFLPAGAEGRAPLPLVCMEGIDHLIIEEESSYYSLCTDKERAERAIEKWCAQTGSSCLGAMFLKEEDGRHILTPLVFVAAGPTLFWEQACASGAAATAYFLADRAHVARKTVFALPGGRLTVSADPSENRIVLQGNTRRVCVRETTPDVCP
ncbi:MAG: hypothetical protein IJQ12_00690 [Lachnospiraceae bacterium]|nr:hypothetical protein [Lachnospiraceae bacterium]